MNIFDLPLVSVIIPAFNCASFIEETLESVYRQTYPVDRLEIIIINDGSTDNTLEVLQKHKHRIWLIDGPNQGPSAAREKGRKFAKGDYIQYLDSDDLLTSDKIKIQIEELVSSKSDVAYGDWNKFIDHEGRVKTIQSYTPILLGDPEIATFTDFWCPLAALLYSKRITDKIGPWNEKYPVIQDARYLQDAARLGANFVKTEGLMAYYRQHSSNSVSTRSRFKFVFDVYQNAQEHIGFWEGNLNNIRLNALYQVLTGCTKYFIEHDTKLFDECVNTMHWIHPKGKYIPEKPYTAKILSKIAGYRFMEKIAWQYRKIKKTLASNVFAK